MATWACEQARGGLRQRAEAREGPVAVGARQWPTQSRVEGGQGLADGVELDPVLVPVHVIPRCQRRARLQGVVGGQEWCV